MTTLDDLKQIAKDTMETIADKSVEFYKVAEEKTKLFAKITKLTAEITLEKGNVRKLYRELGKMYYDLNKLNPDPCYAQTFEEIGSSLEAISAKQQEIEDLKGYVDYEPSEDEDDDADEKEVVEIIVEDFEKTAPESAADPMSSAEASDDLVGAEGDIFGKTPPSTL